MNPDEISNMISNMTSTFCHKLEAQNMYLICVYLNNNTTIKMYFSPDHLTQFLDLNSLLKILILDIQHKSNVISIHRAVPIINDYIEKAQEITTMEGE